MNYHRPNLPEDSDQKAGTVIPAAQAVPAARDPYNSAVGSYYRPGYGYGPGYGQQTRHRVFSSMFLNTCASRSNTAGSFSASLGRHWLLGRCRTLMQTPLYTSTVRLQIDPITVAAKATDAGSTTPIDDPDSNFMRTQYELLGGHTMAERVASALKLGDGFLLFFNRENFQSSGF